jgi:hypothetical protein
MPGFDKTGPLSAGSQTGWGRGPCRGSGQEQGSGTGQGRGRGGGRRAVPGGDCICPNCAERSPHQAGIPCFEQKCPKCGTLMARA